MAERFVSPGVFTKENDLSFLPQGIAQIGAGFVGPTMKGPAFRPVIVEGQDDFIAKFGGMTPDYYTPYAVRSYLAQASRATIVRVLGLNGYDNVHAQGATLEIVSGSHSASVAYIHPSKTGIIIHSATVSGGSEAFTLTVSGANGEKTFTALSVDSESSNYFADVLGTSPDTANPGYAYAVFPGAADLMATTGSMRVVVSTAALNFSGSVNGGYKNARTPWIRSQDFAGHKYNLFQFFALSDGNASNADVKVSILTLRPDPLGSDYGTFSVSIRKFNDTDTNMNILESFSNLTLDSSSPNYIGRRIGTARPMIDANGDVFLEGEYPNNSKYIYVDVDGAIDTIPFTALPYGFAPMSTPVAMGDIPAPTYVVTRIDVNDQPSSRLYYGWDFTNLTNSSYIAPVPAGAGVGMGDTGFDLLTSVTADDFDLLNPALSSGINYRKFTVPMQSGFDGQNPAMKRCVGADIAADNTMGFNLEYATSDGSVAYAQAIATLANPDSWDINLLVIPGVVFSQHPYVCQLGMDMCEDRGDCFFVMDPDILGATGTSAVNAVMPLDTNYTGVYHPWVKILDTDNNKNVWVAPSVIMGGVYAFNDRVAAEWYAPAGLNRGGIGEALQVRTRLSQAQRDELYEGKVNPIAQFPGQGIVVWGQKTLQQKNSALDRINVRRLLITVKKFIASTSRYLVFEPNVDATRQRFLSTVNPYLSSIQERYGLYAFRVQMDASNNTADLIDRNILVGDLFLQPTKTAEYIHLTFNVLPTGATFPE